MDTQAGMDTQAKQMSVTNHAFAGTFCTVLCLACAAGLAVSVSAAGVVLLLTRAGG